MNDLSTSLCERIEEVSRCRAMHDGSSLPLICRGVAGYPCSGGISVANVWNKNEAQPCTD